MYFKEHKFQFVRDIYCDGFYGQALAEAQSNSSTFAVDSVPPVPSGIPLYLAIVLGYISVKECFHTGYYIRVMVKDVVVRQVTNVCLKTPDICWDNGESIFVHDIGHGSRVLESLDAGKSDTKAALVSLDTLLWLDL